MTVPQLTLFESQRLAPATITNEEPVYLNRLDDTGVGFGEWKIPTESSADIVSARKYLGQLQRERLRRALAATATLAAPALEFVPTAASIQVLVSYIPTNWKLAMRIASQSWAEITFADFDAFLAVHTYSSLVASTAYRIRVRYWNGGTVVSPTNTSGTADEMVETRSA